MTDDHTRALNNCTDELAELEWKAIDPTGPPLTHQQKARRTFLRTLLQQQH